MGEMREIFWILSPDLDFGLVDHCLCLMEGCLFRLPRMGRDRCRCGPLPLALARPL